MKKDYAPKKANSKIYPNDQVYDMNSGYCTNSAKIHTYKDLADYVDNGYDNLDRDKKIDWIYNRNVFPSYIEDDGFTRKGALKSYLDLAPKFEDVEKKSYINLPDVNKKEQKPFEQYKTITQTDYTFSPMNVYERLKMNVDKSDANKTKLYSDLPYIPTKSDPNDFITETMDKFRDNKESKKVEEQLKHPFVCDYMYDDGYTKGNKNSRNLIGNRDMCNKCKNSEMNNSCYICPCQYQSRLYCKRHNLDFNAINSSLPINPQNVKPDTQLIDYLKMTKNSQK
eukprot:jgi/Orpsp1_1/1191037/evm.model.d7180000083071.1